MLGLTATLSLYQAQHKASFFMYKTELLFSNAYFIEDQELLTIVDALAEFIKKYPDNYIATELHADLLYYVVKIIDK